MIVYKNYLKVAKSYIGIIIIYTIIFTAIAVAATNTNVKNNEFIVSKPKIAIINNDGETNLIKIFLEVVNENFDIVDDVHNLEDALFFRKLDLIVTIPEGFSKEFLNNENPKLKIKTIPESYQSTYGMMYLNRFFNLASLYNINEIEENKFYKYIKEDLQKTVELKQIPNEKTSALINAGYYYNFSNYTLLSLSVMIVGMIISSFKNYNIKRRNNVSATSYKNLNKELFLGNTTIIFGIWLLYVLISFILYKEAMFSIFGLLLALNSLLFNFTALSIGFLIGNLLTNKEAINGIVNIVALGSSFISGAFVPQMLLSSTLLKVSSFFPSYWYIKNNNIIANSSVISEEVINELLYNASFIVMFGIIYYVINRLIMKYKLKENR